jgi:hypothetical protein
VPIADVRKRGIQVVARKPRGRAWGVEPGSPPLEAVAAAAVRPPKSGPRSVGVTKADTNLAAALTQAGCLGPLGARRAPAGQAGGLI